jgi:hypothetical protein
MTTIYAGTSGAEMAELAAITIDEMKRAAEDMTEAEVARARAQMKAGLLMGLESPSNRAERWRAWCRSGTGCPPRGEVWPDRRGHAATMCAPSPRPRRPRARRAGALRPGRGRAESGRARGRRAA